ncbi:hypothetical protein ACX0G7_27140 [Flavitalea antarctica]
MQKKYIGKYFTFKFKGRRDDFSGVVLTYNGSYTLIRNFTDYVPDGFRIFKNYNVDFYSSDHTKTATKILKVKKYSIVKEHLAPIDSLESIFTYINRRYKLLSLDASNGKGFDVVRYLGRHEKRFRFSELTTSAKWRYTLDLPEKECRYISFDTNYLKSLKLITKF